MLATAFYISFHLGTLKVRQVSLFNMSHLAFVTLGTF